MNDKLHSVSISERKHMEISGVTDVISFDEFSVVLSSVCGGMEIEGSNLHIANLNLSDGRVSVEGTVNGVFYYDETEKGKKEGLFGRMFGAK